MADQQMQTENMCDIDEKVAPLLQKLKKLGSVRNPKPTAVVLKIKMNSDDQGTVVVEDELEDVTTDELREELPEQQPRYVVYSFKHVTKDGRTTYPHCIIYYKPPGCKTSQVMRYAGSLKQVESLSKAPLCVNLEIRDELDDDWLINTLKLK